MPIKSFSSPSSALLRNLDLCFLLDRVMPDAHLIHSYEQNEENTMLVPEKSLSLYHNHAFILSIILSMERKMTPAVLAMPDAARVIQ
jgi:hypothetical protein